uniref:Glutathione S-transferases n=1 Tax=Panonychus citri TaxID=50023 RepID=A0A1W5KPZ2_PANCT|nr:glutathione S-transferases [Panonychus citri]
MGLEVFADYHDKDSTGHPSVDMSNLTIYGSIICPFVRRVLLVLAEKKIPYNFIGIDLINKPQWYLDMYPAGKVPYLKQGDKTLPESLVIANYLDSIYPPTLHPVDPYEKAKGSLLIDEITSPLFTPIRCLKDSSLSIEEKNKSITEMFTKLESIFSNIGTKFLQGNEKPLFSDYMVWPFLEMTIPISSWFSHPTINGVDSVCSAYPSTGSYMKNMMQDAIVQKVSPSYDTFTAYYDKYYRPKTD